MDNKIVDKRRGYDNIPASFEKRKRISQIKYIFLIDSMHAVIILGKKIVHIFKRANIIHYN